jgi:prevent-host-death family protein
MEEITSDQLRRLTSEVLDRSLKGEQLLVTRNRRPVGVLVPMEAYEDLIGVTVRDLTREIHTAITAPGVTEAIVAGVIAGIITNGAGAPDPALAVNRGDNALDTVVFRRAAPRIAAAAAATLASGAHHG